MKKIFTFLGGLLLASTITANAVETMVYISNKAGEEIATGFDANLTKNEDGSYTISNLFGYNSEDQKGIPVSFKFDLPEAENQSAIQITSNTTPLGDNYPGYYYFKNSSNKYPVFWIYGLNGMEDWVRLRYSYIYQAKDYSYAYRYASTTEGVNEFYVCMNISGTFNGYNEETGNYDKELYTGDDEESPWLYVEIYFNDPSEANQAAYENVMEEISAVETEYNDAVKAIKIGNPDADLGEWPAIIEGAIEQAKSGAAQELASANGDLVDFFYPSGSEDIENYIMGMKFDNREAYNQGAYEMVIAKIGALKEEYNNAVAEIKEINPDFDFSECEEIIEDPLKALQTGAETAYNVASEFGEVFNYAFTEEAAAYYEAMIIDMKKTAFSDYNEAEYNKVIATIAELKEEYEAAVAEIKEINPDFDFSEWNEMILADTYSGLDNLPEVAKRALDGANENGEVFFFPFSGEDVQNKITEMKKAAFADYNQAEYDKVINAIFDVVDKYNEAVDDIKAVNPEFDFTEWIKDIYIKLEEELAGAEQALDAANDNGEVFFFPFDAETYDGKIAEMKKAALDSTGIANIEAEVATGKAKIFTLDGKSHSTLVRGQVNVIVKENSTLKVTVK